ncbi:glutamate receptor ionotropic, kainate 4-like isoform X1 [Macrobrachium rosenbergii]|uniref:glutamate receptor ionotropic, kainate 4-like isoform X1 n=1 Tax=Macrobrachium rosenbergii TaxID=79674 RepID=UPI0034D629EB
MQSMVTPLLIVLLLAHWFPVTTCLANKRILPPGDIHFNKPGNMVPGNEYGGVSSVVTYIYETYMTGCHLLLITGGEGSHLSHLVLRGLRDSYVPEAILNLQLTSFDQSDALLPQLREGEEKVTCRVFLFDLTGSGSPSLALEFMDKVQLFLIRHTHVLFIGSPDHLQASLQDKTLWNSVRVLYLSVMSTEEPPQRSVAAAVKSVIKYRRQDRAVGLLVPQTGFSESVVVYSRCLFCDGGEAGIRLMNKWTPTTGFIWNNSLLEDEFADMNGHQLKIVQLDWYPFLDYDRDSNETSTTVTPKDSVDIRMLNAIAKVRNFTYVMRVPWDEQWGVVTPSGNWTGMIGTLQYHKADFSMSVTYLRERLPVIDYTRVYVIEPLVLVSSKPRQIPSYLALVQPFQGKLWVGVLISTASAGIVLWALQLMWSRVSGKPGLPLDISFLSTWSTIFEKPTATLPQNASGLTFLVWWWVYCTLITVVYKSSLVAHLSVPGKSPTIDSFEELLEKKGFTWGFENTHLACYAWLKYNEVPAIQKVFKKLEIQEIPGQMNRVLKGKHVLIVKKFRIKSIVAASYTNRFGYTPVYYSKAEYFRSGHGWGFRRNAPFKRAIDLMKQRLIEAGLVYHWINQMIGSPRKKECKDANCFKEKEEKNAENAAQLGELQGSSENVVLGLYHLQTVFYIFALGLTAALFAFMCENWVFFCTQKTRSVTASEEI